MKACILGGGTVMLTNIFLRHGIPGVVAAILISPFYALFQWSRLVLCACVCSGGMGLLVIWFVGLGFQVGAVANYADDRVTSYVCGTICFLLWFPVAAVICAAVLYGLWRLLLLLVVPSKSEVREFVAVVKGSAK